VLPSIQHGAPWKGLKVEQGDAASHLSGCQSVARTFARASLCSSLCQSLIFANKRSRRIRVWHILPCFRSDGTTGMAGVHAQFSVGSKLILAKLIMVFTVLVVFCCHSVRDYIS